MRETKRMALWIAGVAVLLAATLTIASQKANGQTPLAWEATQFFQFNIDGIVFDTTTRTVKVIFSVRNPMDASKPLWNIKSDPPFTQTGSRVGIDVGWSTTEFVNTGSTGEALVPISPQGLGVGAAYPIQINALAASSACLSSSVCPGVSDLTLRFWVSTLPLPKQAVGTGRAAIEGHPVWPITVNGATVLASVPVKSVVKNFPITDSVAVDRRQVVDINKCKVCHDGNLHGDEENAAIIPRLSLHGANRNEEIGLCVICHNPNQTDIPYRTSGQEESVDFKRMVHGIHSSGTMRENPLVIIGFRGSVHDFSFVRFPAKLKNCLNCHIEKGGKGSFELPLQPAVLGSTVDTRSQLRSTTSPGFVDVDPSNNFRITPIAAACSGCHDDQETKEHMVSKGASFRILQADIPGREQCVLCHGPGKEEDVRRAHDISRSGSDHD